MKKEQLFNLRKMLAVLSVGAIMTGCSTNSEKQADMQNKESDKATTNDGSINPTYEGYYLELKSYSSPDFDLYTTKPLNIDGQYFLPFGYTLVNSSIGYKGVIKSDDIESVDIQKYEPIKNSKGEIISYANIPDGYTLTDDMEFCYRCNYKKTNSLIKS